MFGSRLYCFETLTPLSVCVHLLRPHLLTCSWQIPKLLVPIFHLNTCGFIDLQSLEIGIKGILKTLSELEKFRLVYIIIPLCWYCP